MGFSLVCNLYLSHLTMFGIFCIGGVSNYRVATHLESLEMSGNYKNYDGDKSLKMCFCMSCFTMCNVMDIK